MHLEQRRPALSKKRANGMKPQRPQIGERERERERERDVFFTAAGRFSIANVKTQSAISSRGRSISWIQSYDA